MEILECGVIQFSVDKLPLEYVITVEFLAFSRFCAYLFDDLTVSSTISLFNVFRYLDFTFVPCIKTNLRADLPYNGVPAMLTLRVISYLKVAGNNHSSRFRIVFP